jgi:hypothetical protein
MKTPEIILLEAQLAVTNDLARAKNNELAALACREVVELMKKLAKAHERAAALVSAQPQPTGIAA